MVIARPPRPRLAVAVAAGVALAGLCAAPASAAPSPAGWTPEHGVVSGSLTPRWQGADAPVQGRADLAVAWEVGAEQVHVTVAPADADGERAGAEVTVPVLGFDADFGTGEVDLLESRRLLGAAGSAPVVYTVYVTGAPTGTLILGADDDLADDVVAPVVGGGGPHSLVFQDLPRAWDRMTVTPADQPWAEVGALRPEGVEAALVRGPEHGTLVDVTESTADGASERLMTTVYVADQGFAGEDTLVYRYEQDGDARTETVVVRVGDPRADGPAVRGEDVAGHAEVMAAIESFLAGRGAGEAPAPAEDQTDQTDQTGEGGHAVPEKVETGGGAAWRLAVPGALGAAALLRGRKALLGG